MKIKKNDRAYLLDLKIGIEAKSDMAFQELCLLFDKPEFLDLLPIIRKEFGLSEPASVGDYDEVEAKLSDDTIKRKVNLSKYRGGGKVKRICQYKHIALWFWWSGG